MSGSGRDPAIARFGALLLVRLVGMLTLFLGLAIALRRVEVGEPVRVILAVALIGIGFGLYFFGPRRLARRWRSPE